MLTILNRVNAFALAHKACIAFITLATVSLVVTKFSAESLGYYYVFLSAIGLQILFEQGMSFTVLQVLSREFAKPLLADDDSGRQDERYGLLRKICLWYIRMASLYALFLGVVGTAYFYFFSDTQHQLVWLRPWLSLVLAQSIWLMVMPLVLFKEARGHLEQTWLGKLISDTGAFAVFAICVLQGWGLLSLAMSTASKVILTLCYFLSRKEDRHLIAVALKSKTSVATYWQDNVAQFQKRISYSWLAGYTAHHSISLFLFSNFSLAIVGAFGASWQIIQGISAIALIPIASKMQYLAANEANGLRWLNAKSYRKLFPSILGLACFGHAAFIGVILLLPSATTLGLHQKFLPVEQLLMLCAVSIAGVVITSQALMVRTQLIEPYMRLSLADCAAHFIGICGAIVFNRLEVVFICLLIWQYAFALVWSWRIFSKHLYQTQEPAKLL
jgi:hypothetical protein